MQISRMHDLVQCTPMEISFQELHQEIKDHEWSPFVFKENYRKKNNFLHTDVLVADIDENLSCKDAMERLQQYQLAYSLTFTRNHLRQKNNKVCDRYRIVIPLMNRINSPLEYFFAWRSLSQIIPEMDMACKDQSRYYYPSLGVDPQYSTGILLDNGEKLDLPFDSAITYFLENAHTGLPGTWNVTLNKTAFSMAQKGLSLSDICRVIGDYAPGPLTAKDNMTIKSGFYAGTKQQGSSVVNFQKDLQENALLEKMFNASELSSDHFELLGYCLCFKKNYTQTEATTILLQSASGKQLGQELCERTIGKIYQLPPRFGDPIYNKIMEVVRSPYLKRQKQAVVADYKLNKEHEKTLQLMEEDKKRGTYTLKGTSELRQNQCMDDVERLRMAIKNRLFFITPELTKKVPLYGVELLLIGAISGRGKTNLVANIIEPLYRQGKRILCLTNEEILSDVTMRIAGFGVGLNPSSRSLWDYDGEEWVKIKKEMREISGSEDLYIVDNKLPGKDLQTNNNVSPLDLTNIDQIKTLLDSVERDDMKFDLVILDYISKIHGTDTKEILATTILSGIRYIEEWGKRNNCPTIVFTQLKDEDQGDFQNRIPGAKQIYTAVTNCIEIKTNIEKKETILINHKVRYGHLFTHLMKFDKGRYVDG